MKFDQPDVSINFSHVCDGFTVRLHNEEYLKESYWSANDSKRVYSSGSIANIKYCPGCGEKLPDADHFGTATFNMIGAALSKWEG